MRKSVKPKANEYRFEGLYRYDLVKWRMAQMGLTVDEYVARSSQSRDTIGRLRSGRNTTTQSLHEVAGELGLIVDFLFNFRIQPEQFRRAVAPQP